MMFTTEVVAQIVSHYYHLEVTASSLNGFDELNFLLTDKNGNNYILKIADGEHDFLFLDAQIKILAHLSKTSIAHKIQTCIHNIHGDPITIIEQEGKKFQIRLLSFLDGKFWVDSPTKTNKLYENLGAFLGNMDLALQDFKNPSMHRHYTWDISTARDANYTLASIKEHDKRRLVNYFLLQFEMEVLPTLSSYRHTYAHNDANDYNILVNNEEILGIIDFGDMVYTALINNLAIACTYAMLNTENPLSAATLVVKGYHSILPLEERELSILYYLIAARLCISLTQSAFHKEVDSQNEHHFITEQPAWDLLFKLIEINPIKAQNIFRTAVGFGALIDQDNTIEKLLSVRSSVIGKNLSISYQKHLKIDKAALQYLYDDQGNTYVDCVNNVSHVGHCHPTVVRAMQKQIATLNTNTRYLNEQITTYATKIIKTLPSHLKVCYFTNSGSEANDLAIRISKLVTKQEDVIVLDHAYHGTSSTTIQISPYKFDKPGGIGKMPWVHKAMNPDTYRGPYLLNDAEAGSKYAADVASIVKNLEKKGKAPAAFICETLLGVGGQMPLPKNYLKEVYQHIKAAGGICIADEVQVGFGRVGTKFWGFELQDVVPDIVVMGKPIGNGHPLAAVVVSAEIAASFNNGIEYFNTYGGNPVSMATGIAVMEVIEAEDLQSNALAVGNALQMGLKQLAEKYQIIGDVRGAGLFIGVELIKDTITKEPLGKTIDQIVEAMKEKGFLISTDGPYNNVLKIKPPIIFSTANAHSFVQALDVVLSNF